MTDRSFPYVYELTDPAAMYLLDVAAGLAGLRSAGVAPWAGPVADARSPVSHILASGRRSALTEDQWGQRSTGTPETGRRRHRVATRSTSAAARQPRSAATVLRGLGGIALWCGPVRR